MEFKPTTLPGIILIAPKVFGDERGFFMETYHKNHFAAAGINAKFVQDNHSGSAQGTLRGLHYQIHQAQGKLVRVIDGEIYDVVVDLRHYSPTFGKWEGHYLSAENKIQIWVPEGFAHGFYVVSEWSEVIYKTTDYYAPVWERTLLWNDPELKITWPLLSGKLPILSTKDAQGKFLRESDVYS